MRHRRRWGDALAIQLGEQFDNSIIGRYRVGGRLDRAATGFSCCNTAGDPHALRWPQERIRIAARPGRSTRVARLPPHIRQRAEDDFVRISAAPGANTAIRHGYRSASMSRVPPARPAGWRSPPPCGAAALGPPAYRNAGNAPLAGIDTATLLTDHTSVEPSRGCGEGFRETVRTVASKIRRSRPWVMGGTARMRRLELS